jgi:UDP-glucose 4-epimerase
MSGLDVTVIGATGDLGKPLLRRLEAEPGIGRIRAVGRGTFVPSDAGLTKTEFVRADVVDAEGIAGAVAGADVVMHLAFLIFGRERDTRPINLGGSRNVFRAAVAAGAKRLIYASSAAVYGFYDDRPLPLTEDLPNRANRNYLYTQEKVATEQILADVTTGVSVDTYVFRPCVIGGADSLALVRDNPLARLGAQMPTGVRNALRATRLRPVVFDAGVPMQLVHAEDVAEALALAVMGAGPAGAYNLAGPGEVSISDIARELGWPVWRMPKGVANSLRWLAELTHFTPPELQFYTHLLTSPMAVSSAKAHRDLGWKPRHEAQAVLAETIAAARRKGMI